MSGVDSAQCMYVVRFQRPRSHFSLSLSLSLFARECLSDAACCRGCSRETFPLSTIRQARQDSRVCIANTRRALKSARTLSAAKRAQESVNSQLWPARAQLLQPCSAAQVELSLMRQHLSCDSHHRRPWLQVPVLAQRGSGLLGRGQCTSCLRSKRSLHG